MKKNLFKTAYFLLLSLFAAAECFIKYETMAESSMGRAISFGLTFLWLLLAAKELANLLVLIHGRKE